MQTPMFGKILTSACLLLATCATQAQVSKIPLAISAVEPTPSLQTAMNSRGKGQSLARVVEAFDSQLIDRVNSGRKFEIVGRSDLKHQQSEVDLAASGIVDANDKNAAQAGKVAGAKYMLVTKLDDFEDSTERMEFKELNKVGLKRKIRISAVGKIYDTSTLKLIESANIQILKKDDRMDDVSLAKNAEMTDELLQTAVREMAEKISMRITDVIYPAKVLAVREKQITVNRGDGTGIAVGQVWNVYAVGEELKDPDTGEILGKEEVLVGKARITSVLPKTSTAELLEDSGTAPGAIVRLPQTN
jgi:hypothetical protein